MLARLSAQRDISFNWRSPPLYIQSCFLLWIQSQATVVLAGSEECCKEFWIVRSTGAKSIRGRQMRSGDLPICIIFPPKPPSQICRPSPSTAPTYFRGALFVFKCEKMSFLIARLADLQSVVITARRCVWHLIT